MNSSHMESSNCESLNHLKRRQTFDSDRVELETEDTNSNEGSHKKARYAWQIKRSVGSLHDPVGVTTIQNSLSHQDTDFVLQNSSLVPEPNNEPKTLHLQSVTDHESVQMEDSGSDVSVQNDSRYYDCEDQTIDLSSESQHAVASTSQESEHQSAESYRRYSFPILSNRFPGSHQDSHESVSRNSDLAVWQSKHVAKSIVDNAINKTLEEMGVSPEKEQDEFMTDKSELESQGISEAIKTQGLIHQSHHSTESRSQLSPLLSHLRRASDLVFTQSGSQNLRSQDTSHHHMLQRTSESSRGHSSRSTELTTTMTTSVYCSEPSNNDVQMLSTNIASPPDPSVAVNVPASSSEILDHAVSLVISNQGLSLP